MTKEKRAAGNKVLPKAGLNSFDWTFVQGSTFVLRLNFCAKNPAFGNTQTVKLSNNLLLFNTQIVNKLYRN
ncbi:MAG: hypothetical protein M9892_08155 [Bacteroidetes bacterium]|nr:hypothetical protein [Bacteroidota bacterium]